MQTDGKKMRGRQRALSNFPDTWSKFFQTRRVWVFGIIPQNEHLSTGLKDAGSPLVCEGAASQHRVQHGLMAGSRTYHYF